MNTNGNLVKFPLTNATFVSGEGSLCYKDVIADFPNAKYIDIITYNISASNNTLLNQLQQAGMRSIPIKLITNIPNRWNSYWSASAKSKARDNIKLYQRKLKPEAIGKFAKIFFKFNNHGKIILTDNIIYWGSANFSDESSRNYECGTLSTDKKFIEYIHNEIIPSILANSVDYYKRNYINYIASLYSANSYIHNMFESIHDACYGIYEDYDTNFESIECFNYTSLSLSWKTLQNLMETIKEFEELLSGIIFELDEDYEDFIEDEDFEHYEEADNLIYEFKSEINSLNELISSLCYDLNDVTTFDVENLTFRILSNKYGNVAYDEHLEHYLDLASEQATEAYQHAIDNSKDIIDELLDTLSSYQDTLLEYIDKLIDLSQIDDTIDNTY